MLKDLFRTQIVDWDSKEVLATYVTPLDNEDGEDFDTEAEKLLAILLGFADNTAKWADVGLIYYGDDTYLFRQETIEKE